MRDTLARLWARFRGLPIWAQLVIGFVVLVLVVGPFTGDSDPKDEATPATQRSTTTRDRHAGCTEVTNTELEQTLRSSDMWAAKADGELGRSGEQAWYISDVTGATWVTNIQPTDAEAGGLLYPMNAMAEAMSDIGADVGSDAPIRAGFSDSDATAERSRVCAKA